MSNLYHVTLTFPSSTEPIKKYLLKHEELYCLEEF